MTNKTVLSDADLNLIQLESRVMLGDPTGAHKIMRATEEAVLQSPEIQQLRKDAELLSIAVQMLADWCVAVKENGTGWDDWDEHYKDAAYRDNPLRSLIDAAMEVKP